MKAKQSIPISSTKSLDNQKSFLEKVKAQYAIKDPSDWGRITSADIIKQGGASLIARYRKSLFIFLQSVYQGAYSFLLNTYFKIQNGNVSGLEDQLLIGGRWKIGNNFLKK